MLEFTFFIIIALFIQIVLACAKDVIEKTKKEE